MTLSEKSIDKTIQRLEDYKRDLAQKCEYFCKYLLNAGMSAAKWQLAGNEYAPFIAITMPTDRTQYGCDGALVLTQTGIITSYWQTKEGVKSADVSPLLMAEFGAGNYAENPKNIPGVGQGTFPDQTHGNDPSGWYYLDLDGKWHHSYGVKPAQPVLKAFEAMYSNIDSIAKEVFK